MVSRATFSDQTIIEQKPKRFSSRPLLPVTRGSGTFHRMIFPECESFAVSAYPKKVWENYFPVVFVGKLYLPPLNVLFLTVIAITSCNYTYFRTEKSMHSLAPHGINVKRD